MEKKYESDLTRKEKRQMEIEKLKSMSFKKKVEYLVTYYKWVLLVLLVAVFFISMGVNIYRGIRQKTVLSVVIADAVYDEESQVEKLQTDLLKLLGSGKKNEEVMIDTSAVSGETYGSAMKMTVVMSAGDTDILVCSGETYEEYAAQDAFLSWEEILGADYEKMQPYLEEGKLNLSKSEKWRAYHLTVYEPAYAGVLRSSDKKEEAVRFAEYFSE